MTSLLQILRDHEEAVEADLSHYHRIDYRDRWRRDEHGRRRLTLRMIWVRIKYLPPESALGRALGRSALTQTDVILADLFRVVTGHTHPSMEPLETARESLRMAEREERLADARRRARERQAAIDRGDIT